VSTIVSGLGVRERRSSFRKAISKDVQPTKDYEKIWPQQQQQQEYVQQMYGKIQTPERQRKATTERPTPVSRKQLSQQEQMQQLAMAKAMSSRPPDPRALVARLYGGPTTSEFTPADSVYATKNNGTKIQLSPSTYLNFQNLSFQKYSINRWHHQEPNGRVNLQQTCLKPAHLT